MNNTTTARRTRLAGRVGMAAAMAVGAAAWAQHDTDFVLRVQDGRIETGRVEGAAVAWGKRVNGSVFEFSGIPNVTTNPGYDSFTGAFQPNQIIGLSVRKALRRWTGAGFGQIPQERLQIVKGSFTIETPAADPTDCRPAGDLILGRASASGRVHEHPAYALQAPFGSGVYMVEVEVWMNGPGQGASLPLWVVLGQNADPAVYDAAVQWADENVVPQTCYANCDASTGTPTLSPADFVCYLNRFRAGECYANCDGSTGTPSLSPADFVCFLNRFRAGCS